MKIVSVEKLALSGIKIITFGRFRDQRGYFTEQFRNSDLFTHPELTTLHKTTFVQANESYSRKRVLRGLHFQWSPYMGKLVRTIHGHMIDLMLDIRKDSQTFGKILTYDMPSHYDDEQDVWIWVPPGFAHGNYFLEDTIIEYFCTGEYSSGCEAAISPFAPDIDWDFVDEHIKKIFSNDSNILISDKDKKGLSLADWSETEASKYFKFDDLKVKGLF